MIRVIIVDDHPVVRFGLKHILLQEHDMEVVGEAESAQTAVELVRKYACDVVVLDITLPGGSGVDVLKQLKSEHPRLPVLILSVHPEEQYAVRAVKAGASGYLEKDSAPAELVKAVRLLVSGRKYIAPSLAERLAEEIRFHDRPPHERLSDREFEVMRMISQGRTPGEIAQALYISEKTVSTYRARVLEKMKMKTSAELAAYAIRNNLME
jgi:two-component system invasion response regulator UvrY